MPKTQFAKNVDGIQAEIHEFLKPLEFRKKGRTFNRHTVDGLTQVINLQMGASDPPGTTYIPGLRENLHGLFTINLGIFVPEVHRLYLGKNPIWVLEYNCSIRSRLGQLSAEKKELWWRAELNDTVV